MTNPQVNVTGLSESEAQSRLLEYGFNRLNSPVQISAFRVFLDQFRNILIIILLAATGFSAIIGHEVEAVAISVIVLFSVIFGFIQEYRAEHALHALRKLTAPTAIVVRDGAERLINAENIVPGDVLVLAAGDIVAADAEIFKAVNLYLQESALTGESVPVHKITPDKTKDNTRYKVFAGTTVVAGKGLANVIKTGMDTEFGKIAGVLKEVKEPETPLQKNLDVLGKRLGLAALLLVVVIVTIGVIRGEDLFTMLLFGIALAVAVVPEALPAVVTVSLALGVQRLVKRKALVRKLAAVETLGSTTVICTDKTGTLTKDEMTVRVVVANGKRFDVTGSGYTSDGNFVYDGRRIEPSDSIKKLLTSAVLASDAALDRGDPTERSLIVAGSKAGLEKAALEEQFPRIDEEPFTAESRRMITVHADADRYLVNVKGAPETIISMCSHELRNERPQVLMESRRVELTDTAMALGEEALRVLAVATKSVSDTSDMETGYTLLGFVGMIDPPRDEVFDALTTCEQAGIRVIMVTGDHPTTAKAIAKELGVFNVSRVASGADVESMTDEELKRTVLHHDVFARVAPNHKLRIVEALQSLGATVAMTGDGINDAPALRKADIGVAMGIKGTDVARETAAITLTDDNFASIVASVEEGRRIFNNIKKFLMFLISSNIGEIGVVTIAAFAGLPLPLTAVQLLYINLATDGLPALSLAVDPPERGIMRRRPRSAQKGFFTKRVLGLMLLGGLWSAMLNLGVFIWALNVGKSYSEAVTMTFVSLILVQFFKAYAFRSDRVSTFEDPFSNKWLNAAIVWEFIALCFVVHHPMLQEPFGTFGLSLTDWAISALSAATILPVIEIAKRRWHYEHKTIKLIR
ncbi:MAG: cation-translocating P-type ATPase [Ignavibacteria bacterium]|nr:cation-translocating P-type ATPase [Ignavibacteria bacterium]